jgi:hypothetical protein
MSEPTSKQLLLRERREHLAAISEIRRYHDRLPFYEQSPADLERDIAFHEGAIAEIDRQLEARRQTADI